MRKYRVLGAAAIVLMLIAAFLATILYRQRHFEQSSNSYASPLAPAPLEQYPLSHIGEDFTVDEGFTSHLPIVILDTDGVEPPISAYMDSEQNRFIDIEGIDPYVNGRMEIICGEEGLNSLTDAPQFSGAIRIKRRGNSSMLYEKAQWLIKLVTDSGQYNDVDILGMGAEHEWILNGSMFDKSMLRNYLAYSIASEFIPYTPDNKFCEVILRDNGKLTYQGVYLLGESIKQGKDRVNIADYSSTQIFNSYLVRRDRLDDSAVTLDNYGRLNNFSAEYLALLHPNKYDVTDDTVYYVQQDISAMEKVIYSDNPKIFSTYPDVIDVDSFIDYFLLNEFFASYDTGNYSTYFYKDLGKKLAMGPVWDYDGTMDNYRHEPLDTDALAMQTKPWFDRLCKDMTFLKKMERRYAELRHTSLSEKHITAKIDEIVLHLGAAQQREWARWGHWYTGQNEYSMLDELQPDGTVIHRNAETYHDEIYRIKSALRAHGDAILQALNIMERSTVVTSGIKNQMGWLLLLAAAVFFVPSIYAAYRK